MPRFVRLPIVLRRTPTSLVSPHGTATGLVTLAAIARPAPLTPLGLARRSIPVVEAAKPLGDLGLSNLRVGKPERPEPFQQPPQRGGRGGIQSPEDLGPDGRSRAGKSQGPGGGVLIATGPANVLIGSLTGLQKKQSRGRPGPENSSRTAVARLDRSGRAEQSPRSPPRRTSGRVEPVTARPATVQADQHNCRLAERGDWPPPAGRRVPRIRPTLDFVRGSCPLLHHHTRRGFRMIMRRHLLAGPRSSTPTADSGCVEQLPNPFRGTGSQG